MNQDNWSILLAVVLAVAMGALVALDPESSSVVIMILLGGIVFGAIGWKMRNDQDATWFPRWVLIGYAAKVVGTLGRNFMVTAFYEAESSDAFQYYLAATKFATDFHAGQPVGLSGGGSLGTQITEVIAGGLFVGYLPNYLGGFLMFAMIAFCGQLLFYAAFRFWMQAHQLKLYAAFIFLLPTFAFWPSSIGKDAIVILCLGASAYFIARMLRSFHSRWVFGLAPFLVLMGLIRIHLVALVVIALIGAMLLARPAQESDTPMKARRLTMLTVSLAAGAVTLLFFPDLFGVEISSVSIEEADEVASEVVRRTSERGTIAAGGPVDGPEDVPGAIALVLFRPFIFEASEIQHFFAAAETTLLLGITLWQAPTILRHWRQWRSNAYVVFSSIYVLVYAIAFSVVRNLGIVARQRGQVLAFFLVIIIGMGTVSAAQRGNGRLAKPAISADEQERMQSGQSPPLPRTGR